MDASEAAQDDLTWEMSERMLSQEDEDEEAAAEADATEADQNEWTSLLPSWISAPEDQELMNDPAAPATPINWSLTVSLYGSEGCPPDMPQMCRDT